eukprot:GHVU01219211.1.p1 GENE.GHVU01219211.1~~GHVU01219211.1.p1  ORF type:complete len:217 (-),score=26.95 GHVU01219211.1:575-1225(-)
MAKTLKTNFGRAALCVVLAATVFSSLPTTVRARKEIIDPMEHEISVITGDTFTKAISQFRATQVSAVLFYTNNDASKKLINGDYNKLALELKGMVKVSAIYCGEWMATCTSQGADKDNLPTLMIYPPLPRPHYKYTKEIKLKELKQELLGLVPGDYITKLGSKNTDLFLSTSPAVPKVLLFSKKPTPPTICEALSNAFQVTQRTRGRTCVRGRSTR